MAVRASITVRPTMRRCLDARLRYLVIRIGFGRFEYSNCSKQREKEGKRDLSMSTGTVDVDGKLDPRSSDLLSTFQYSEFIVPALFSSDYNYYNRTG
jgi:hypothetical protein